jgi:multiple sugar transport system ATP-binding protein
MTEIKINKLTKEFGETTAVDNISLTVDSGEFVALVGPSGCGKSTTLRLIAGLESPTSGDIHIDGSQKTGTEPDERDVSMVFQNYALFPHMNAQRNMAFGANYSTEMSSQEINETIQETAEILDISDLLERKPAELSGGEKQRVAIGRSLVRNPGVLLLDEPLANLDLQLRLQMRTEIKELHDEFETTIIYVTHNQEEAMTLADRVAVLNNGSIQQINTPQRLYDLPKTSFVADFLSNPQINMIPAQVQERDDQYWFITEQFEICFEKQRFDNEITYSEVELGIRPEDLYVIDELSNQSFQLEVLFTETLGDSLVITGKRDGSRLRVLTRDPQAKINSGDRLTVRPDPARILAFHPDSGQRIAHSGSKSTQTVNQVRDF